MTETQREAIKRAIQRQTAANTASPEAAREALLRMGLVTNDGQIAPEYDGQSRVISSRG